MLEELEVKRGGGGGEGEKGRGKAAERKAF